MERSLFIELCVFVINKTYWNKRAIAGFGLDSLSQEFIFVVAARYFLRFFSCERAGLEVVIDASVWGDHRRIFEPDEVAVEVGVIPEICGIRGIRKLDVVAFGDRLIVDTDLVEPGLAARDDQTFAQAQVISDVIVFRALDDDSPVPNVCGLRLAHKHIKISLPEITSDDELVTVVINIIFMPRSSFGHG